jgi:hypothetical protein
MYYFYIKFFQLERIKYQLQLFLQLERVCGVYFLCFSNIFLFIFFKVILGKVEVKDLKVVFHELKSM